MQLVRSYVYPEGTYLLGMDRENKPHGMFCWSAEDIAFTARDWRLSQKDEATLAKRFMHASIPITSQKSKEMVHGIGAEFIDQQFTTLQHIREINPTRTSAVLNAEQLLLQQFQIRNRRAEVGILLYTSSDGDPSLALLHTRSDFDELMQSEPWIESCSDLQIWRTRSLFPDHDRFNQHPLFLYGPLIRELIVAHVLYLRYFPPDPAARN